jgi:hypothetical protein
VTDVFLWVKKTNLANPKKLGTNVGQLLLFFFHNWLSGFFFGTTHGININYLKKKKTDWLSISSSK